MSKNVISMSKVNSVTLKEGLEDFLEFKKSEGKEATTIKAYSNDFSYFIEAFGNDYLCHDVTAKMVTVDFPNYLRKRNPNIRDTSIQSYLVSTRAVLYYLIDEGYMPPFKIKIKKIVPDLKAIYTPEELEKLLRKPKRTGNDYTDFLEFRNWFIINILICYGIRVGSLVNIRLQDIRYDEGLIHIRKTKSKVPYTVPLTDYIRKLLKEYLRIRKGEPTDYLICNVYGEKLTADAIKNAISRYNKKHGVSKTSVHLFRHTMATNYLKNGGLEGRLQQLLGHSTREMTQLYARNAFIDVKQDFEKLNPLNNLIKEKTRISMKKE